MTAEINTKNITVNVIPVLAPVDKPCDDSVFPVLTALKLILAKPALA